MSGLLFRKSRAKASPRHRTPRNPLGTALFGYGGLPYYKTSRETRLLRGSQLRYIAPTAIIRITDLEQTLLDTLQRPLHCGGPAVVFEAWDQGIKKLPEDRLAHYLASMQHRPTAQRLGYMFTSFDYKPGDELTAVLNQYRSQLDAKDPSVYQQLFPGMRYDTLLRPWLSTDRDKSCCQSKTSGSRKRSMKYSTLWLCRRNCPKCLCIRALGYCGCCSTR